jgi:hypothetical protein
MNTYLVRIRHPYGLEALQVIPSLKNSFTKNSKILAAAFGKI